MNTITKCSTLAAVNEILLDRQLFLQDRLIQSRALYAHSLTTLEYNNCKHLLTKNAQQQLCNILDIPIKYMRRCYKINKLQSRNIQSLLDQEPEFKKYLIRFDGSDIRAILSSDKYQIINNIAILKILLNVYSKDIEVNYLINNDFFMINILPEQKILRGKFSKEAFKIGISISNSETGQHAFTISSYILRVVCTNGLIVADSQNKLVYRHVKKNKPLHLERLICEVLPLKANSTNISLLQSNIIDKLDKTYTIRVSNTLETIKKISKLLNLTRLEYEATIWGINVEPGDTLYHIINALTKGAQYPLLSEANVYNLLKAGGKAIDLVNQLV